MRKILVIVLVIAFFAGGTALAAWAVFGESGEEKTETLAGGSSYKTELEETTSPDGDGAAAGDEEESGETSAADAGEGDAESQSTGEDFSYTSPDQRYVTETQRHQNFFKAVAEGKVKRLDCTSVDYQPVGDPNTSYVYFTMTSDSGRSNGTFVMKLEGGMWRIAAINQVGGDLEGGTNYMVPASFEDDLAREIAELQSFLTKVAEGRFAYMQVDNVIRPNESETILTGVVVGKSGRTVPAEMRLRKDYGLWHLTYVTDPP